MEKVINKLIIGEGKLSLLLLEARPIALKEKNDEFLNFIDDELNGYKIGEIPEYRKIKAEIVGTIINS